MNVLTKNKTRSKVGNMTRITILNKVTREGKNLIKKREDSLEDTAFELGP